MKAMFQVPIFSGSTWEVSRSLTSESIDVTAKTRARQGTIKDGDHGKSVKLYPTVVSNRRHSMLLRPFTGMYSGNHPRSLRSRLSTGGM